MQASPFWRRYFLCAKTAWNCILLAVQSTKQNQQNVTKTNSKPPPLSLSLPSQKITASTSPQIFTKDNDKPHCRSIIAKTHEETEKKVKPKED